MFVPLELGVGQCQLVELFGEGRQSVVVAQDVVEVAVGVDRQEPSEPMDALFDGFLVGVQAAPAEVEDIATENKGLGLGDGRFDVRLHLGPRATSGEQMKVGDKMGFGQLHGLTLSVTNERIKPNILECIGL